VGRERGAQLVSGSGPDKPENMINQKLSNFPKRTDGNFRVGDQSPLINPTPFP